MKKKDKNIIKIVLIALAFAIIMINAGVFKIEKFSITDNDFLCESTTFIYLPDLNISVLNGSILYKDNGINRTLTPGQTYYKLDNNQAVVYNAIPELTGTHKIYKYSFSLAENNTAVAITKCSVMYTKEIQYQNITKYVNKTVEKEVTKEVMIEPTLKYIVQTYKYYLIGIIAAIVIAYLIFGGRRKK